MPHNIDLIVTLTAGLTAALIFGFVTQRLRLSPIVGYLLAGVAVGPFTPGYVANAGLAEQLAELGVILLMFGVGLHFHLKELLAVKTVAIPGAIVQIAVATGLGVVAARAFGLDLGAGIVYGLAISVASTVVLLRVLSDFDALHTPAGHVAVGWLLVEDLFTVLALVMLPVLAAPGATASAGTILQSIGLAVVKIAALVAFTFVVGRRVIPLLLGYVAKTRSRELFTLTVLVLALGIAVGSATLFGASMALGAFLAGMIVGQSDFSSRAASEALPLRDAFAVLFFVSMGMLFDPMALAENLGLTLATLAVILVGKPVAALVVVLVLGRPVKTALSVAVALAQIGEFSFMLAALGRSLDVFPPEATQALVAASIVSITLNPVLFHWVEPLARRFSSERGAEAGRALASMPPEGGAVVVGCGPVGRAVVELLEENHVTPTIIELNHETVRRLRAEGKRAIYGDATQPQILTDAGITRARSLVVSTPGLETQAVIRAARELNPNVLVVTRAAYLSEVPGLQAAGAHTVVSAEGEVALAMTESLLHQLGATAEQLDRARERIRERLRAPSGG